MTNHIDPLTLEPWNVDSDNSNGDNYFMNSKINWPTSIATGL